MTEPPPEPIKRSFLLKNNNEIIRLDSRTYPSFRPDFLLQDATTKEDTTTTAKYSS